MADSKYTDDQLIAIYEQWSEEYYSAGFINPDDASVKSFYRWLTGKRAGRDYEWYELEFLKKFRELESNG